MSSEKAIYELKAKLKHLEQFASTQTSLISLYVPGSSAQINEATNKLTVETSQATNIKSKQTSKTVQRALRMLHGQIKTLRNKFPKTGLAFFAGVSPEGKFECVVVEPLETIRSLYICDKQFVLDPLLKQLETGPRIGVAVFDTANLILGEIQNGREKKISSKTFMVPKKQGKGGQSAPRFQRQRV